MRLLKYCFYLSFFNKFALFDKEKIISLWKFIDTKIELWIYFVLITLPNDTPSILL